MGSIVVKGILSYPHLFTPRHYKDKPESTPKYSAVILVPKSDKATIAKIEQEIAAAKAEFFGTKKPPTGYPVPWREYDDDENYMRLSASASDKLPPVVIRTDGTDIDGSDPKQASSVYGGLVCAFEVKLAIPKSYTERMACFLNKVVVTPKVGALGRLDGRMSTDKMLASIEFDEDELAPLPQGSGVVLATQEDEDYGDEDAAVGFNV